MALRDRFSTGLAGPQVWAFADAIEAAINDGIAALEALRTTPDLRSASLPAWALAVLGQVMGLPRAAAWSDADYLLALRAQAIARRSNATLPDLYEIAEALSPLPNPQVWSGPTGATFWLPGASDYTDTEREIVGQAILRAIEAVADLQVLSLPATLAGKAFRLDSALFGLDNGLLVDTIFTS